jgi:hypothetical protein
MFNPLAEIDCDSDSDYDYDCDYGVGRIGNHTIAQTSMRRLALGVPRS